VLHQLQRVVAFLMPHIRRFGRPAALVGAGVGIAFDSNHGNMVGLSWALAVSLFSLAVRNDSQSTLGRVAWWTHGVFVAATLVGLVVGRLSPQSALSLAIALVVLEGARAALRGDRVSASGSGILAVVLTVIVSITNLDSRDATGAIGVWAIVLGVFGVISAVDGLSGRKQKRSTRGAK